MMKTIAVLLALGAGAIYGAEPFVYPVFSDGFPTKEAGQLEISPDGVHYRSDNGKTKIQLPLLDVLEADVGDPSVIRITAYDRLKKKLGGRRVHTFRLREGVHGEDLARYLSKVLPRPVVGDFALGSKPVAEIRAYHRHLLGGCHGTLTFDDEGIRFASQRAGDSRTWRYRDVESVGNMNDFHFRVTTLAETFNFDLQERLLQQAYQLAVRRVYELR